MTAPIRVFIDIHSVANRIADDSDEMRSTFSRVNSDADYWTQANGKTDDLDIFNEKFETTSLIIKNFADALEDQADTLNRIADNYEQARERAVSRARGLSSSFGVGGLSGIINTSSIVSSVVSGLLGMVGLGSVVSAYNTVSSVVSMVPQIINNPESLVTSILGMAGLGSAVSTYYTVKNLADDVSQFRDHPEKVIRTAAEMAGLGKVVDTYDAVKTKVEKAEEVVKILNNPEKEISLPLKKLEILDKYKQFMDKDNKITDPDHIKDYCNELRDAYINTPKEMRGDVSVPRKDEWCYAIDEHGNTLTKWDKGDGTVPGSRKIWTNTVGERINRIGSEDGKTLSPLNKYGKPYSADERSVPNFLQEKNIENESSYHDYVFTEVIGERILKQRIYKSKDYTKEQKMEFLEQVRDYYSNVKTVEKDGSKVKVYSPGLPQGYRPAEGKEYWEGMKYGKTAPQYFGQSEQQTPGGGYEIKLPLSVKVMKALGLMADYKE